MSVNLMLWIDAFVSWMLDKNIFPNVLLPAVSNITYPFPNVAFPLLSMIVLPLNEVVP